MVFRRPLASAIAAACAVIPLAQPPAAHALTSATACPGLYTLTVSDSIANGAPMSGTASWQNTCATVAPTAPLFGEVTVVPNNGSNAYTYTGNCVAGTISYANGTTGVFVGGVAVIETTGPGAAAQGLVAVLAPARGAPLMGAAWAP